MPAKASPVSPSVLAWAIEEDGRSLDDLATALNVDAEVLDEWVSGDAQPTTGQVSKLATVLKRPRALFFLPRPPEQVSLPASFRHPPGEIRDVGAPARRIVRQARRIQHAVSWALRTEPIVEVPRWTVGTSPEDAAAEVRAWLGVTIGDQQTWNNDRDALTAWRHALDERGILVFALEIGSGDVRGFSSWDDHAPLIATNISNVSPAARSFTLGHELGHLVVRQNATCVEPSDVLAGTEIERWCERFSAALLMPRGAVLDMAHGRRVREGPSSLEAVRAVATGFRVSHRAAALRLIDLGLAERSLYADVTRIFKPKPPARASSEFRRPARSTSRLREYGPRVLETVLNELPPRDALSILRMKVEDVRRVADEVPGVRTF